MLVGVLALKKASQSVVIAAVPALMLVLADAAGAELAGAELAGADELDALGLLLPQAATVAASAAAAHAPARCARYR